jgi:effector-binding domain-containing protein
MKESLLSKAWITHLEANVVLDQAETGQMRQTAVLGGRAMKKFLLWLLGGALLLLLAGFVLPRHVVGRASADINASPQTLTLLTSSMRQFNRWSPWGDLDPATAYTFDGPYGGVGSAMTWASNNRDVGKGGQKVVAVVPGTSVSTRVMFDGSDGLDAKFSFEPLATSTKATWSFDFDAGNNPITRWVGLFIKGRIINDYTKGLAKLQAIAEAAPKDDFDGFEATISDAPAATVAVIAHDKPVSTAQIGQQLGKDYAVIGAALASQKLALAGAPRATYEPVGAPGKPDSRYKMAAQMPVPPAFVATDKIARLDVPAGPALRVVYRGPYDAMAPAYDKAFAYLKTLGLTPGASHEDYVDDPQGKDMKTVRTDIVIAVKY